MNDACPDFYRRDREPPDHAIRCAIWRDTDGDDEVVCSCGADDEESDVAADIRADRREIARGLAR